MNTDATHILPGIQGISGRALNAAVLLYTRWETERERSPLDRVVAGFFRSRRDLNSRERRWISEAIYGCVRFLRRQTLLLEASHLADTPENRIRLWAEPALPGSPLPTPDTPRDYLRITLSFPDALADELEALLGPEALTAAAAFNTQAPTTLRVNTLRTTRARVLDTLEGATPTRYSPWGVVLAHRVNIYDLPGFREGWYEVQEEASQLVALSTNVQPGQIVVDVGAGAGGKTLALAALMQNQGRIVAVDSSAERLEELEKRAARAGATCIETCVVPTDTSGCWQPEGRAKRTLNRLAQAADCVLVDAPCTGSGVLRRSPDAKWRTFDLDAMTAHQQMLLTQAASLVRTEGTLLYATCAFERRQNEEVAASFLTSAPGAVFQVEALCIPGTEGLHTSASPYLRTWPHRHGMDAFFAVCLKRRGVAPPFLSERIATGSAAKEAR
ncbi:MAG TPA: RsmB/NOP family class I SAM-dependent RNA methyltransferase [Chthonomonadaceae bacterium]|nr:RsmB/NOP family class I SAM-dependent RNA methyltransferase [Chthonomonadaceae bacterium]